MYSVTDSSRGQALDDSQGLAGTQAGGMKDLRVCRSYSKQQRQRGGKPGCAQLLGEKNELLSRGLKLANMHLQHSPAVVPSFSVPYTLKITQLR